MLHAALQAAGYPNNAFDITYHMYWPSSTDPFWLANQTDNLARKNYYGVNATPTFKVDGAAVASWPQIESVIQARIPVPSPLWLDLTAAVNGNNVTVTTSAVANTNIQGNYVIQIMVLDRYEYLPASPNGQPNHYHSLRQITPTSSGQAFSAVANDTVHHTATFTIQGSWGTQNDIDVVCFVQDNTSKEILQGHSEALPVNYPGLALTCTPIGGNPVIPAIGGQFSYNVGAANSSASTYTFSAWSAITMPNGSLTIANGPLTLTLPPSASITRQRNQSIPGSYPAGSYTFAWYVGAWPNAIWATAGFPFTKSATGDGGEIVTELKSSGESFEDAPLTYGHSAPADYQLLGVYPNPFNPTATISYELRDASFVNLAVYDLAGHEVAQLVNGWREAGMQDVTFDGSNLASGIYVYRLDAGSFSASGKMVLMK